MSTKQKEEMARRKLKNISASIRARLLNLAKGGSRSNR